VGGREGKQLRAQRIQGDAHSQSELQKMATVQRKVHCVLRLAKFESVTQVRREYRRVFGEEPPHENNIRHWDRQLKETGSLLDKQRSGRRSVNDESAENIRNSFTRSLKKSVRERARESGLSKPTIHRDLKKSLLFTA
jgi:transposase